MLVLSRKQSQQIVIGRDIRITVVKVERNQVRLGIDAPQGVAVLREELVGRQRESKGQVGVEADRPRVQTAWPEPSDRQPRSLPQIGGG